jgi:hypothetical protein
MLGGETEASQCGAEGSVDVACSERGKSGASAPRKGSMVQSLQGRGGAGELHRSFVGSRRLSRRLRFLRMTSGGGGGERDSREFAALSEVEGC